MTDEIRFVKEYDQKKCRNVILYVLNRSSKDFSIGINVLENILYFIDFDYYELFEESFIGGVYIKSDYNPATKMKGLHSLIELMKLKKEIRSELNDFKNCKLIAMQNKNLKLFNKDQIKLMDNVLSKLYGKTFNEIKSFSYNDMPIKIATKGEEVSYESVFYRTEIYSVRKEKDEL